MTVWKQTAGWSSGSLYFEGSTSGRELFYFDGDNVSVPPLRGRINMDIVASGATAGGGVVNSVANPTTETLWVESAIIYIETASSSSSFLSLQIATADSSSGGGSNILADATVECTTAGLVLLNSSGTFPIAWNATSYLTAYVASSSDGVMGLDGVVSVFYVSAVTT